MHPVCLKGNTEDRRKKGKGKSRFLFTPTNKFARWGPWGFGNDKPYNKQRRNTEILAFDFAEARMTSLKRTSPG
jgi:hypothetical protein